jgi:hypothetical protein
MAAKLHPVHHPNPPPPPLPTPPPLLHPLLLPKKLSEEVKALAERRVALVAGRENPTAEELADCDDAEARAAAGGGGGAVAGKGCPFFWASVLTNCDAVSESVARRDRLALEYLRDVRRVAGLEGDARGVELVFDIKARADPGLQGRRGGGILLSSKAKLTCKPTQPNPQTPSRTPTLRTRCCAASSAAALTSQPTSTGSRG